MANISHSTLTGADLHEPKGADTANSDTVYRADGAGSGAWKKLYLIGVEDYNDAATATTPISLASAGVYYGLTNDGAGPATNKTYKIPGFPDIWNVATNQFSFTHLALGDTVDFRVDIEITTSASNHEITLALELGIGSAAPYTLEVDTRTYKNAGTYRLISMFPIYLGDTTTKDYPARFVIKSDATGDTVKVNGWYVRTSIRNPVYA